MSGGAYSHAMDPLAGIEAKLERAAEHFEEFNAYTGAFLDRKPCAIRMDFEKESGWHIGRVEIREEPPYKISVIAGEAIGQCRSVLDHLMTAAVLLDHNVKKPPPFPIYRGRDDWLGLHARNGRPVETYKKLLRPEQFALVERLQPCNKTPPTTLDALSLMQAFRNVDQHHDVNVVYNLPKALWRTGMPVALPEPDIETIRFPPGSVFSDLRDGTEVYRVRFRDNAQVRVVFDFVPGVELLTAGGARVGDVTLASIIWFTCKLVDEFRTITPEFFPLPNRDLAPVREWEAILTTVGLPSTL